MQRRGVAEPRHLLARDGGERWDIRYEPANPSRVWADAFLGTRFLPLILGGIGGVGLIVAGGVATFAFRRMG